MLIVATTTFGEIDVNQYKNSYKIEQLKLIYSKNNQWYRSLHPKAALVFFKIFSIHYNNLWKEISKDLGSNDAERSGNVSFESSSSYSSYSSYSSVENPLVMLSIFKAEIKNTSEPIPFERIETMIDIMIDILKSQFNDSRIIPSEIEIESAIN